MHLQTRNVNTGFRDVITAITEHAEKRPSRNGNTLTINEPVTITYSRPKERVLFNKARDANPFFHVYEAMWMLAGRRDLAPLLYFVKDFGKYSDDGKTLNGAYGYRWRHIGNWANKDLDQLDYLVEHIRQNPDSRRAVLTMWNIDDDLKKIDGRPSRYGFSRDVCCNLCVMFSIRDKDWINREVEHKTAMPCRGTKQILDMTVVNRSNDAIWGTLGANYVHFTFLQEYMAARIGVEVGVYNHFTNNLHAYENNWKPDEWLKNSHVQDYGFHIGAGSNPHYEFPASSNLFIPLVTVQQAFEEEVKQFTEQAWQPGLQLHWREPFFREVAVPMMLAYAEYKRNRLDAAINLASEIKADDWRFACVQWLQVRKERRDAK